MPIEDAVRDTLSYIKRKVDEGKYEEALEGIKHANGFQHIPELKDYAAKLVQHIYGVIITKEIKETKQAVAEGKHLTALLHIENAETIAGEHAIPLPPFFFELRQTAYINGAREGIELLCAREEEEGIAPETIAEEEIATINSYIDNGTFFSRVTKKNRLDVLVAYCVKRCVHSSQLQQLRERQRKSVQ